MPAFQPTADQFRAFRDDPHDGPIAQVNLLKFKDRADYGADAPEASEGLSGADAYRRYALAFQQAASDVGGTCVFWGEAERMFIGDGDYDSVMIMLFPNRQAFIATLNHPDYNAMHRHRDAGLLHQDLIVTRPDADIADKVNTYP